MGKTPLVCRTQRTYSITTARVSVNEATLQQPCPPLWKACQGFSAVVHFCRINCRGEHHRDMSEPQTWRELLREVIKNPLERKRIAAALGVNPITVVRWIRSES